LGFPKDVGSTTIVKIPNHFKAIANRPHFHHQQFGMVTVVIPHYRSHVEAQS
jgi:hypothetical protein